MKQVIERLKAVADDAVKEYKHGISTGGEPEYPQWIHDVKWLAHHATQLELNNNLQSEQLWNQAKGIESLRPCSPNKPSGIVEKINDFLSFVPNAVSPDAIGSGMATMPFPPYPGETNKPLDSQPPTNAQQDHREDMSDMVSAQPAASVEPELYGLRYIKKGIVAMPLFYSRPDAEKYLDSKAQLAALTWELPEIVPLYSAPVAAQPSVTGINWPAVQAVIKEYVSDYEMVGESDSAYDPSAHERALIEDAIHGLLAEDAFIAALRPTPPAAEQAQQEPTCREFTNELGNRIRITIEGPASTSENILTPYEVEELRLALNERGAVVAAQHSVVKEDTK